MGATDKPPRIRRSLTRATCALLGTTSAAHAEISDWQIDSALLYYAEKNRVTAVEPVVSAATEINDEEFLRLRVVVDALTGESPSGAIAQPAIQTFTSPSGGRYNTNANTTPLDPSFKDTRAALNVEWELPLTRERKLLWGGNVSREFDYTSLGISATHLLDTDNKLRTWTAGVSLGLDFIEPVGGVPQSLTVMPDDGQGKSVTDDLETKTVIDALFGITQIIDRKTIAQFNYSIGYTAGYLSDPYKILSNIDADTGLISDNDPNDGITSFYRYEARPDKRFSQSLYAKWVHQFKHDVVNISYRFYSDDWGVTSHTVDARYRWELGNGHYLQPHIRWYRQNAADFFTPYLLDGETPRHASADYRLGDMTTLTTGIGYGIEFSDTHAFSMRIERMIQSGNEPEKFGALSDQTLFEEVEALIFQLGYKLQF